MTLSIKQRAAAYLELSEKVRALDALPAAENERLEQISAILVDAAKRTELFPIHAFPRAPGSAGGLFRLAEFPDRRGAVYISLGFTGRSQTPHRHASWAIVAGVSGGDETNVLYDFEADDSAPNAARLHRLQETVVGPGQAVSIGTGVYHTIHVESETPVLHLHAYGLAVDTEGYELPFFESAEARTFGLRSTGGFRPPLSSVLDADIRDDVARGDAALIALDGAANSLSGPHVYRSVEALIDAKLALETPIVVAASESEALNAAQKLYASGRPLVFHYRAAQAAAAAA